MRAKGVAPKMPDFVPPAKPFCLVVLARKTAVFSHEGGGHAHWTPAAYFAMDHAFREAVIKSQGR